MFGQWTLNKRNVFNVLMGFLSAEGTNVVRKHFCLSLRHFMKEESQLILQITRFLSADVFHGFFPLNTASKLQLLLVHEMSLGMNRTHSSQMFPR